MAEPANIKIGPYLGFLLGAQEIYMSANRIEPRSRNNSPSAVDLGLQAKSAGPPWMLGRSWQLGEYKAENAGSPIKVDIQYRYIPLTKLLLPDGTPTDINSDSPLEMLVEAEYIPLNLRERIVAGQKYKQIVLKADNGENNYQTLLDNEPSLLLTKPAPDSDEWRQLDDDTKRYYVIYDDKVIDGQKLIDNINSLPNAFNEVNSKFMSWFEKVYPHALATTQSAWKVKELAYGFTLLNDSENLELIADKYRNGEIDWYSVDIKKFDVDDNDWIDDENTKLIVSPSRINFAGKPDERWWAFEDNRVNLSAIAPDSTKTAATALNEFALVYSDDWQLIPLPLPTLCMVEIKSIVVTDCFGETMKIQPAIEKGQHTYETWQVFQNTNLTGKKIGSLLFIPPSTADRIESQPIEKVNFMRDESANLLFAVEEKISNGMGNTMDVTQLMRQLNPDQGENSQATDTSALPKAKLNKGLNQNWVPFKPIKINDDGEIELRRATLACEDEQRIPYARTKILDGGRDGTLKIDKLYEETVTRAGLTVELTRQLTRDSNGKIHSWIGRKVKTGKGQANSGFAADVVEE